MESEHSNVVQQHEVEAQQDPTENGSSASKKKKKEKRSIQEAKLGNILRGLKMRKGSL